MNKDTQTQVLIVGAGPAGLVAGITLARYAIAVLVVEKRDEVSPLARALVISTRSMELLRTWGLEHEVRAGAADVEPSGWVTRTLASGEGLVVPSGHPTAAQAARVSPTRPAWAPQSHLELVLLASLHPLRYPVTNSASLAPRGTDNAQEKTPSIPEAGDKPSDEKNRDVSG